MRSMDLSRHSPFLDAVVSSRRRGRYELRQCCIRWWNCSIGHLVLRLGKDKLPWTTDKWRRGWCEARVELRHCG